MSTRSYIGISDDLIGTNKARCVYCHFDGYLEGVGVKLYKFFNSAELAEKLTSKYDIRSLGETIQDTELYTDDDSPFDVDFASKDKGMDDMYRMIDYRYIFDKKTNKWYVVEKGKRSFPTHTPLEDLLLDEGIISEKQETKPQSNWHKGTPTEEGLYVVFNEHLCYDIVEVKPWTTLHGVVAYQKIEPYKED